MKSLSAESAESKSNRNLHNVDVQCEVLLSQPVLAQPSVLRMKSNALLVTNLILLVNVENYAVCSAVDDPNYNKG
tara:strand:- start:72 stop:296 length:225 start_codon:yes stop_codon:yes gene_type:complete